jgi:hypothetical protein
VPPAAPAPQQRVGGGENGLFATANPWFRRMSTLALINMGVMLGCK